MFNFLLVAGLADIDCHNHPLPGWVERSETWYHRLMLQYKLNHLPINGTTGFSNETFCTVVHTDKILVTSGSEATRLAKLKAGGHCALYDALELHLFNGGVLPS